MKVNNQGRKYTIDFSSNGSVVIDVGIHKDEIIIPKYVLESLGRFLMDELDLEGDQDLLGDLKDLVDQYG